MPDYRTTHPGAKAGLSSLRTGVSCVLRATIICVVACITLLMIPVSVYVNFNGLYIDSNHAYADDGETPPLPEPPRPSGPALTYVDMLANQAQMDPSQFVATTICALGASTGMIMAANPGIKLIDGNLYENLDALVDAADYPAWDSLTYEEQMEYGNKQDYDAAKYLSLMDAFDLSSGYERYQDSLSSGGSDFTFNEGETSTLSKLGRIGENWVKGIGNTIGDIKSSLNPSYKELLYKFLYGDMSSSGEHQYNGEKFETWDDSWYISYKQTNIGWVKYGSRNAIWKTKSLDDCYLIMLNTDQSYALNYFVYFSKAPFTVLGGNVDAIEDDPTTYSDTSSSTTENGHTFYVCRMGVTLGKPLVASSQTVSFYKGSNLFKILEQILFSEESGETEQPGELVSDIPSYPSEQLPDSQVVYYPVGGVSPETTWNQYTEVQRPENPYNPDDQTSTPEWKQETKQNIQGLQGVHFEKLFPFCLYYDLDKFWKKVQRICGISTDENGQLNTQDNNNYNEINLRMYVPDVIDEVWTFDLEPLRDLLLITKPFMLVFLICVEIVSMIMLWKGILTGS